jgi:hypothetical protein
MRPPVGTDCCADASRSPPSAAMGRRDAPGASTLMTGVLGSLVQRSRFVLGGHGFVTSTEAPEAIFCRGFISWTRSAQHVRSGRCPSV